MIQLSLSLSNASPVAVRPVLAKKRRKRTPANGHSPYFCNDRNHRDEIVEWLELTHGYQRVSFEWQLRPGCFTTGWGERVMQFEKRDKDTGEILRPEVRAVRPKVVWIEPDDDGEAVN